MMQSFDHGYYLLVKSIQELREKKRGLVTVGIGGPSGSGKTRYSDCMFYVEFVVSVRKICAAEALTFPSLINIICWVYLMVLKA